MWQGGFYARERRQLKDSGSDCLLYCNGFGAVNQSEVVVIVLSHELNKVFFEGGCEVRLTVCSDKAEEMRWRAGSYREGFFAVYSHEVDDCDRVV